MNNHSEQALINSLLADEDITVDWEDVYAQSTTQKWQIAQNISQKVLEDFLCYSTDDIKNIISFFALDPRQQLDLIPSLAKQTLFDFRDGDLRTDKALLVLANQYMDMINSLSNRLLVLNLEEQLIILEAAMWDIYSWIERKVWENANFWDCEGLLNIEWQFVRKLSRFIKQYLNIEVAVTSSHLKQIIIDCLHP
ncbi:MAG: hypothetical protein AAF383_11175 [Cyanobacteria bacterium P01_A01_bin.83]